MNTLYKVRHPKKVIPVEYICFTEKQIFLLYGKRYTKANELIEQYWRTEFQKFQKNESIYSFIKTYQLEQLLTSNNEFLRDFARYVLTHTNA